MEAKPMPSSRAASCRRVSLARLHHLCTRKGSAADKLRFHNLPITACT